MNFHSLFMPTLVILGQTLQFHAARKDHQIASTVDFHDKARTIRHKTSSSVENDTFTVPNSTKQTFRWKKTHSHVCLLCKSASNQKPSEHLSRMLIRCDLSHATTTSPIHPRHIKMPKYLHQFSAIVEFAFRQRYSHIEDVWRC